MKNLLLILFLLFLQQFSKAATYYISATGSDSLDGRSTATAFQTLGRVNALTLQAGDSVLFNRGNTFRGMLQIKNSGTASDPIYIGAYGSGAMPVLSGAEKITGWNHSSGNIFTADCPNCPGALKQIFVREALHIPARYPNSGYFTMTNVSDSSFTAANLTQPAGTWDSATIYLRTEHWIIDEFQVKEYTPGNIVYTIPPHFYTSYAIQNNFGYFLSGKYAMLDSAGEWYYDTALKRISLIPEDSVALLTGGAEVSVYDNCIQFSSGVSYITIKDLRMEKSLGDALSLNQTSFITIVDCQIAQAGRDGVGGFKDYATSNSSLTIQNCTITDICNTGINLAQGNSILLNNNQITRCGLIPGMGLGADGMYEGIYCPKNSKVLSNFVDSVGYTAIHVNSNDTVMYNRCYHYGLTKNDCGGIYFWNASYNYIAYNFTGDGFGNGQGTIFPDKMMLNGIYSDDFSNNNIIEYNTTFHNESGIMLHKNAYNTARNNIAYDNWLAQLQILEGSPHSNTIEVHNNQINNNVFQCLSPSQRALYISTEKNNIPIMGTFTDNWYCNPYASEVIGTAYSPEYASGNSTYRYKSLTLSEWQNTYGFDNGSHIAFDYPTTYANYLINSSDLIPNSTLSGGTGWWWTYGNTNFSLSADASNIQMDGTSLKGQYQNTSVLGPGNWGTSPIQITKDKHYLLTYRIQGENSGGMDVALNFNFTPYTQNVIPTTIQKSFTNQAKDDSILFTGSYSEESSLALTSSSYDGNFWMDNIYLYEVIPDTSDSKPHSTSILFQNPSASPRTISVAGKYRTLDGTLVSSDMVLDPYTSIVLKSISAKVNSIRKPLTNKPLTLFPNPATQTLFIQNTFTSNSTEVHILDIRGQELYQGAYIPGTLIDLPASWANGMYILILKNGDEQFSSRFSICR